MNHCLLNNIVIINKYNRDKNFEAYIYILCSTFLKETGRLPLVVQQQQQQQSTRSESGNNIMHKYKSLWKLTRTNTLHL